MTDDNKEQFQNTLEAVIMMVAVLPDTLSKIEEFHENYKGLFPAMPQPIQVKMAAIAHNHRKLFEEMPADIAYRIFDMANKYKEIFKEIPQETKNEIFERARRMGLIPDDGNE